SSCSGEAVMPASLNCLVTMPANRLATLPRRLAARLGSRRAVREERALNASLRVDPSAGELVLSPHLDDAVLDCWSVLASDRDVSVVNIFAGVPENMGVTLWDSITGARDSAERVLERIAEDGAAVIESQRGTPAR